MPSNIFNVHCSSSCISFVQSLYKQKCKNGFTTNLGKLAVYGSANRLLALFVFFQPIDPIINNTASLIQSNSDSTWPPYLKDFLIQDSGAKDSNALCVDDSLVASGERPGQLLLTVHNDGDSLLLHADSHAMPSVQ